MSTHGLCCFCGSCQFDFKLVRVPPIPNDKIKQWTQAFGSEFVGRITRLKDQNPLICKEHIGRRMLNVYDHTLDMEQSPELLSTEEIRCSFNYFHDHCYAKQSNFPQVCANNGALVYGSFAVLCLQCGETVAKSHVEKHTKYHCEGVVESRYKCQYHSLPKNSKSKEKCYKCMLRVKKAHKQQVEMNLKKCFPTFECYLTEHPHGFVRTSIRLSHKYRTESRLYNKARTLDLRNIKPIFDNYGPTEDQLMDAKQEVFEYYSEHVQIDFDDQEEHINDQMMTIYPQEPIEPKQEEVYEFYDEILPEYFETNMEEGYTQGEFIDFDNYNEPSVSQPEQFIQKRVKQKRKEAHIKEDMSGFIEIKSYGLAVEKPAMVYEEESDEEELEESEYEEDSKSEKNDPDYTEVNGREYEEDPEEYFNKHAHLITYFDDNPHPSVLDILRVCYEHSTLYHVVFHMMDRFRKHQNIVCEPDDNCEQIRKLFIEEKVKNDKTDRDFDKESIDLLENEAMKLIAEGFSFTSGEIHWLASLTELPVNFVRWKTSWYRQKYFQNMKAEERIQEWNREHEDVVQAPGLSSKHVCNRAGAGKNHRIPKEALDKLEELYQNDRHLHGEPLKELCELFKLKRNTVTQWFGRRRRKEEGDSIVRRYTFTQEQKDAMNEEFMINQLPTRRRYKELAEQLDIPAASIASFFTNRRTEERKKMELEGVKGELDGMSKEVHEKLMEVFKSNKSVKFDDRVQLSTDLGLSYQAVTFWLERETVNARNPRGLKRRHEEIEESEDEEDNKEDNDLYDSDSTDEE